MLLMHHVLLARRSQLTQYCPLIQDVEFGPACGESVVPAYMNITVRRWKGNEDGRKAREWNKTHANPSEKYALWELSPQDTAKFESRDPRWKEPSGVRKNGGTACKYVVFFNEKYIGIYPTLEAAYFVWNAAAREWNDTHANPFEKYALFPSTPGDEAR